MPINYLIPVAVAQDATGNAHATALAYAQGIGGTRAGVLEVINSNHVLYQRAAAIEARPQALAAFLPLLKQLFEQDHPGVEVLPIETVPQGNALIDRFKGR